MSEAMAKEDSSEPEEKAEDKPREVSDDSDKEHAKDGGVSDADATGQASKAGKAKKGNTDPNKSSSKAS